MAEGDVYSGVSLGNFPEQFFIDHADHILKNGQLCYLDDDFGKFKKGDNVRTIGELPWLGDSGSSTGTVQYITTAPNATPADTDIMVSLSALSEDFLLKAPASFQDVALCRLRIKSTGTFNVSFDPIYRFSLDLPVISKTKTGVTIYYNFIKNNTDGTLDCVGIDDNFNAQVIPNPPYIIASNNTIVISDYAEGSGPSAASQGLAIFGLGLPGNGNGTLTQSANTELSDDFGATWQSLPILIPYVSGAVTTPAKYKIRFKTGLTVGSYSENVVLSASTATDFLINVSTEITASAFDPDALIFFAYLSPQPSSIQKLIYNDVFLSLKRTGNWNGAERIWITATENQQHARISLKNPASNPLSEVNNPNWNQYQGYTSDGATSYIETHYSMLASSVFLQNDASFGVYVRTDIGSIDKIDIGVLNSTGSNTGIYLNTRSSANSIHSQFNANTAIEVIGTALDSRGFTSLSRTGSAVKNIYKNGIKLVTTDENSTGRSADTCTLLAYKRLNTIVGFSQRQLSMAFFGNGSLDQLSLYNTIQTYMTSLGTQV